MGTAASDRSRLIEVTAGNLRQNHLYVRSLYDFFPPDIVGGSRRNGAAGQIELILDGLNETVHTDIGRDAQTGRPRGFLRCRGSLRRFYEHHNVRAGDRVVVEKISPRKFRLAPQAADAEPLRAAEFFAGIGLVRLALERCGWQVVFANDIDEAKAEMYRDNWPRDDHLKVDDIHKLSVDDIPDCELFTASFPCNDLSIAGKWEGLNGKESSAFWGFVRILEQLKRRKPPLIMLENVVGFLMRHKGHDLEQALTALNELGYAVDAVILNAKHWTPQSRARLFIIGRLNCVQPPKSFALRSDARPDALIDFIVDHPNIVWDIHDLPPLPQSRPKLTDILEDLPDNDEHWWSGERCEYFMGQLSRRHEDEARQMIRARTVSYATAFRRVRKGRSMAELRTDGIAGCLRTPRGGSGRQILLKAGFGKYQVRLLTARECARLQGVPDEYLINVPLNKALFGFGDAVCVPAVEWIVRKAIMRTSEASSISAVMSERTL